MREIKFRGQSSDNGQWIYGWYATDDLANRTSHYISEYNYLSEMAELVQPETVSQYTGLKDKNNTEIYEGDIVRILYTDWMSKSYDDPRTLEQYLHDIAIVKVVVWSYNGFYVSNSTDGYAEDIDPGTHGYIQVIGNIHQNPELLNQ
jgi:uncharacterized phage protein (TIGR01671 family)